MQSSRLVKRRVPARSLLMLLFLAVPVLRAVAHPHVFVSNRMAVVFEDGELKGIEFSWTFDPMFSAMILHDFCPDADGTFSSGIIQAIKTNDFDNLENYHYFLAFFVGRQPVKKIHIQQFKPYVADGERLIYSFFVPLNLHASTALHTLRVTVYDDTYYVAFDLMSPSDVQIQGGADMAVDLSVEKTKVQPLWPGQYMPDQLVIQYHEKS